MLKTTLSGVFALTLALPALSQSAPPLAGDADFLSEAYGEAEAGDTFSYAGQWGSGQPWTGQASGDMAVPAGPLPTARPTQAQAQSGMVAPLRRGRTTVTPQTGQSGVSSDLGTVAVSEPQRAVPQTLPRSAPQPRMVNTIRTVRQQPAAASHRPHQPSAAPMAPMPNARPGECFARMQIPAQYQSVPKQVAVSEAYERARLTQAQFARDTEEVIVKDAHTRYVVRQPKFAVKQQQVMLRPAYDRLEVVPARFTYTQEQVQVTEPRLVWKRGVGLSGISRTDPRTGETWCLVEEPGRTITINKRVVAEPEQVRRVPVAAQTVSVARQVLIDEGGVEKIQVPAQTRSMTVQRLVAPGKVDTYTMPGEFDTIEQRQMTAPERFEWVSVLCDTNAGPDTIKRLQTALAQRGLYKGRIDGIMGPQTRGALVKFQRGAGLPHAGYLTTDTMAALGIRH